MAWKETAVAAASTARTSDVGVDPIRALGRVGLWSQALDLLPASMARDVVQELEDLGYPSLWISEGLRREIFVNASLLLSATRHMVVATGVANIWARDAAAMVAGQLTLAEAFDGRFLLGMGVSQPAIVEGVRGHVYSSPLKRMSSYLDAMDEVRYQSPAPTNTPPRVLAAVGPRMLELAGRRSAGAHPYFVAPEHTAAARAVLGPDRLLCPEQAVVLETDPDQARAIARRYAQFYLGFPSYRNDLKKHGFVDSDFSSGGTDRVIDAVIAWGDVDAVRSRVQAHLDAGADHVSVQVLSPDTTVAPLDQWRELAPVLRSCS
ncbi:LLM class F420-dependent oxidoreductase [Parafrankia sp. EUN1f]|uniref:LLM class F420-dependent oxidoreductase n=1 Tax=Parafrankia sp. EUN1f TaxID=102897 RepID=UPI0001C46FC3|nr:LLM class F420-dependent oxidoreductase [Parafrankia sp. EUN1f]EFC86758.1 Coenzyme F420-dependent N5 N10-methylene tetrahydromethanopterin reductase-like protein [Parafrankia sp. EUN1f]